MFCIGYLDHPLKNRHCEKRLGKRAKGGECRAGKRSSLGQGMLCWSAKALRTLSARFSGGNERVRKAEPKGSAPRPVGKAYRQLGSGTEGEMKQSRGRIRDLRMRLAGKRAEGNRTEPTGVECSVTNFLPLPYPLWHLVSKGATPAGRG
jgi:hypothetical protein